jgi:hypothetical protein
MNNLHIKLFSTVLLLLVVVVGCSKQYENPLSPASLEKIDENAINLQNDDRVNLNSRNDFVHGIIIDVKGEDYYLAGPADGPNGENDVPGHEWRSKRKNRLIGKHYNTGPFGASQWWSSDAEDGALLYEVDGIIDSWTMDKAENYAKRGFLHYHELLSVADGSEHPRLVIWLRHIAVTSFTLDGGPHPELSHSVSPGVDLIFIPNWFLPYNENQDDFVHGIKIKVDGRDYYLAGPADGPNGENDIPGHDWRIKGNKRFEGRHYNTGPFGASSWWSSDADDGQLLYLVDAVVDTWTTQKAKRYAQNGYLHYHELISVANGNLHPNKIVWLKHIAVSNFTLDGGPHPEFSHPVSPGIDFDFLANWQMPYKNKQLLSSPNPKRRFNIE